MRSAAAKSSVSVVFARAPWLYAAWRSAKWLVLTYPAAPIWAVMIVCGLLFGSVVLVTESVRRVKAAAKAAGA